MTIWHEDKAPSIDDLNERGKNTLFEHLGMTFISIDDHSATATMPVDHRTRQPLGILNGGSSLAMAEAVTSAVASFTVNPETHYTVGLEINANHLRSVKTGNTVTGTARAIHRGRKTQVWEFKMSCQDKLCCTARFTVMVLEK